jgi:hypothetical protein
MRNIPDNNLAYPVFIKLDKGGTGSGFLLNTGESMYLISAKHVFFDDKNNLRSDKAEIDCQTQDINDESIERLTIDLSVVNISIHATSDVAAIHLGDSKENTEQGNWKLYYLNGVIQTQSGKTGTVSVSAKMATKKIKDVLISNDVYLYGYPTSLGLSQSPQFDFSKPLLRKGIVANIYKPQGTIILDCPSFPGNSGGPVVEVEFNGLEFHHKVIGIVSQFIPHVQNWVNQTNGLSNTEIINSGYSVTVSMDKVFETIGYDPDK